MPLGTRRLLVRLSVVALAILVLSCAGGLAYLRLNERAFVYLIGDRRVADPSPALTLNEQRISYPSTDGVTISGWLVPAAPASTWWLLICHGNLGNIGYAQRPEFYAFMRDVGVNLLAFDYRGYGESSGAPDEPGLYDDATASYRYLTERLHIAPDRVVLFGHSLGSGVAIELASRVPAAGLIVDGAYTSVVDRARELYPLLPVALVATQRFPSLDRIASVRMPKLFLHSPEDTVIPYAHGRRLFAAAREPKRFVDVKGGHEYAYRVDKGVYYGAIGEWMRSLPRE
jgi:uncharacterized protein